MQATPVRLQNRAQYSDANMLNFRESYDSHLQHLRYRTPPRYSKFDNSMLDNIVSSSEIGGNFVNRSNSSIGMPITQMQDQGQEYGQAFYVRRTVVEDKWKYPSLNMSYDPTIQKAQRAYEINEDRHLINAGRQALHNNSFSQGSRTPENIKRPPLPRRVVQNPIQVGQLPVPISIREIVRSRQGTPSYQPSIHSELPRAPVVNQPERRTPSPIPIEASRHITTEQEEEEKSFQPPEDTHETPEPVREERPKIAQLFVDNTRFNVKTQYNEFLVMQQRIKATPIEAYEVLLYSACKRIRELIGRNELNLSAIEVFYPLVKIQERKNELDELQTELFEYHLQEVLKKYPKTINEELKTFGLLLRVINALLIHWNIAQPKKYNYRFKQEFTKIKHIDLNSFIKGVVSLDVLWLCFSSEHHELMSATQKALAVTLRQGFQNIVNSIVALNNDADFANVPSIEGYVTLQCHALVQLGFRPDNKVAKPTYAFLKLPKAWLRKSAKNKPIANCYERMRVFENVYKQFEATLLKELPKS